MTLIYLGVYRMVTIDGSDEQNIQHAILQLMSNKGAWTNAQLKRKLKDILPLTQADREVGERENEELWENRVNNALGEARASSLYSKGFVQKIRHGHHRITQEGLDYISGS